MSECIKKFLYWNLDTWQIRIRELWYLKESIVKERKTEAKTWIAVVFSLLPFPYCPVLMFQGDTWTSGDLESFLWTLFYPSACLPYTKLAQQPFLYLYLVYEWLHRSGQTHTLKWRPHTERVSYRRCTDIHTCRFIRVQVYIKLNITQTHTHPTTKTTCLPS